MSSAQESFLLCNFFHLGMSGAFVLGPNSLLANDMPIIGSGPMFATYHLGANPEAPQLRKKKGTKHSCNVASGLRF